jgi:hypothetical protein
VTVGCGGKSPTSPSSSSGAATIAGTVQVNGGAAHASGAAITSLTVTVVGTDLSSTVDSTGYFQIGNVPPGKIELRFQDAFVNATVELSNVGGQQLIEIRVQVTGTTATIVEEIRADAKVSLCHRTDAGFYRMIDVSQNAEATHRSHGDAKPGEQVPGDATKTFDSSCRVTGASVRIEKSTNGRDADEAPGPEIEVGAAVSWEYVVTNTGTVDLTGVSVTDDRGVAVTCPSTTLAPGQSMTCTGSGVAALGQYRNVGTVTAQSSLSAVTDTDPSHYLGILPEEEDDGSGEKVDLCHRTGAGFYVPITISVSAEPAHRAHGDGKVGEAVPGQAGKVFGAGCSVK